VTEASVDVVIRAGPNGAGKSTVAAAASSPSGSSLTPMVIARGLSAFDPGSVSITAGRMILVR